MWVINNALQRITPASEVPMSIELVVGVCLDEAKRLAACIGA